MFFKQYTGTDAICVEDGMGMPIQHFGDSCLASSSSSFLFQNLLHISSITKNLVFVLSFCIDNSYCFEFNSSYFSVNDNRTKWVLLTGPTPIMGSMCFLPFQPSSSLLQLILVNRLPWSNGTNRWATLLLL